VLTKITFASLKVSFRDARSERFVSAISAARAASFWEGGEDGLRVMLGWEVEEGGGFG
jgi:hypothetical protein